MCVCTKVELRQWTNANFDVTKCHPWIDLEHFIVDAEGSNTTLIVVSSLHATNALQVRMTTEEEWTCRLQSLVILRMSNIRLRVETVDVDGNDVLGLDDGDC